MFCRECGTQNLDGDRFCKHCGSALIASMPRPAPAPQSGPTPPPAPANLSTPVPVPRQEAVPRELPALPEGIKGWCWGGFLLNWIWAIGNKTWWGLLALIPGVNIGIAIWLGLKGREMAWRNGQWQDLEHFNRVQRKWSFWGVLVCGVVALWLTILVANAVYQSSHDNRSPLNGLSSQDESEPEEDSGLQQATTAGGNASGSNPLKGARIIAETARFADILEHRPTSLDTVGGLLERRDLPSGDSTLMLNGKPIFDPNDEDAKWFSLLRKFSLSNGTDAVLAMTSGGMGTSCEAQFVIFTISKSDLKSTNLFGSCSTEGDYMRINDKITITISKMGGKDQFVFENGVLSLDGKAVE